MISSNAKWAIAIVVVLLLAAMAWVGGMLARSHGVGGRGSVLEFHIVADAVTANPVDLKAAEARMEAGGQGPARLAGDRIVWFEVDHPERFDATDRTGAMRQWLGKYYMPLLVTPDASMDKNSIKWGLKDAYGETDPNSGERVVSVEFDASGKKLLDDLTTHWSNQAGTVTDPGKKPRLAVVVGGKITSAPHIGMPLTLGRCEITGGGPGGLTAKEVDDLVHALNQ
jgi:hypothetical protein